MVFGVTSWTFLEDLSPASPCTLPLIFQSQAPGRTMPFHGYGPSLSFFRTCESSTCRAAVFGHAGRQAPPAGGPRRGGCQARSCAHMTLPPFSAILTGNGHLSLPLCVLNELPSYTFV